jgi:hypothetical protein
MAYIKLDDETFEETQPNKRILLKDINNQIDDLQNQKIHFGVILDKINSEIQQLRDLKRDLQSL